MVQNSPCNAGHTGAMPDLGRSPRASEKLEPCITAAESQAPTACAPRKEKPPATSRPHSTAREGLPLTATRDSPQPKNTSNNMKETAPVKGKGLLLEQMGEERPVRPGDAVCGWRELSSLPEPRGNLAGN